MGEPSTQEVVTISAEKLRELEAAQAKLKEQEEKKNENLKKLKNYKRNPETNRKTSLETYYRNKEAINDRRRAAYKAKKEAEAAALASQV